MTRAKEEVKLGYTKSSCPLPPPEDQSKLVVSPDLKSKPPQKSNPNKNGTRLFSSLARKDDTSPGMKCAHLLPILTLPIVVKVYAITIGELVMNTKKTMARSSFLLVPGN